jgi:hypothetical protein
MSKPSIYNTLQQCCEFEKKEEKIQALRANGHPAIYAVLKHMFDPNIKFLLPKGDPPYNPLEFEEPGRLYTEARKFYLFVEGGHNTITQKKREAIFVSLLENINKEEAKLVLAMKDKKSPIKGLTKNLVATAFPGLLPDEQTN